MFFPSSIFVSNVIIFIINKKKQLKPQKLPKWAIVFKFIQLKEISMKTEQKQEDTDLIQKNSIASHSYYEEMKIPVLRRNLVEK